MSILFGIFLAASASALFVILFWLWIPFWEIQVPAFFTFILLLPVLILVLVVKALVKRRRVEITEAIIAIAIGLVLGFMDTALLGRYNYLLLKSPTLNGIIKEIDQNPGLMGKVITTGKRHMFSVKNGIRTIDTADSLEHYFLSRLPSPSGKFTYDTTTHYLATPLNFSLYQPLFYDRVFMPQIREAIPDSLITFVSDSLHPKFHQIIFHPDHLPSEEILDLQTYKRLQELVNSALFETLLIYDSFFRIETSSTLACDGSCGFYYLFDREHACRTLPCERFKRVTRNWWVDE